MEKYASISVIFGFIAIIAMLIFVTIFLFLDNQNYYGKKDIDTHSEEENIFESQIDSNGITDNKGDLESRIIDGQIGKALKLDKTTYVIIGDDTLDSVGKGDFSIESWFKVDTKEDRIEDLMFKGNGAERWISFTPRSQQSPFRNNGALWFQFDDNGAGHYPTGIYERDARGVSNVKDGKWHHGAGIFERKKPNGWIVKVYVDGVLENITNLDNYDPLDIGDQLRVFDKKGRFLRWYDGHNRLIEERTYYGDTDYATQIVYPTDGRSIVYHYDNNMNPVDMQVFARDRHGNNILVGQEWYQGRDHPYIDEYKIIDVFDQHPSLHGSTRSDSFYEDKRKNFVYPINDKIKIVDSYLITLIGTLKSSQKLYVNDVFKGEVRIGLTPGGVLDTMMVFDSSYNLVYYFDYTYSTYNCAGGQINSIYGILFPFTMQTYRYIYSTNDFCNRPVSLLLDIVYTNGGSSAIYDPYPELEEDYKVGLSELFRLAVPNNVVDNFI